MYVMNAARHTAIAIKWKNDRVAGRWCSVLPLLKRIFRSLAIVPYFLA